VNGRFLTTRRVALASLAALPLIPAFAATGLEVSAPDALAQLKAGKLILVDIRASLENCEPDYDQVQEFARSCSVPLTVGGGITNVLHVERLLGAGADKVSINTAACATPDLVNKAVARFGSQCIVASIDFQRLEDGGARVFASSGTKDTGRDPVAWAKELADRGAGEILLTSIARDGTMQGYDLDLTGKIASSVSIPVIASGGAGCYQHLVDAVLGAGASAVAAASIFHFTEQTPKGAKKFMQDAGIPVRLS
jgi:cyclase